MVHFGRPINEFLKARIPGPTARTTQTLGFGQIGLAASQFPFRFPFPRILAGGDAPSESTGKPQSLCLGQIRFALTESVFGLLAVLNVGGPPVPFDDAARFLPQRLDTK